MSKSLLSYFISIQIILTKAASWTKVNQELQTNSYSKSNLSLPLIPLNYLHADDHKTRGYSYPRVAAIRIDVHPARETWYTRHVCFPCQFMYTTHMLPLSSPRTWQPFLLTQQSWTNSLLSRKRTPVLIHKTPNDRSTGFSPITAIKAVG
jgi:hypothetical protein